MNKKIKGFTLIELLAVVLIIGILLVIAVPAITRYLNIGTVKYYNSMENSIIIAGREYLNDYRTLLPKEIGNVTVIELDELVSNNYIDAVVDSEGNSCQAKMIAKKTDKDEYEYYTCLVCDDYETEGDSCGYTEDDNITGETKNYAVKVEKIEYKVNQGDDFTVPTAKAYYLDELVSDNVIGSPKIIDTNKLGTTTITYSYKGAKKSITVEVVDNVKPSAPQVVLKKENANGNSYNDNWYGGQIYAEFKSTDYTKPGLNGSGIDYYEISTDGRNFTSLSSNNKLHNENGKYEYFVRSVDKAGNISDISSYILKIDTDVPSAPIITGGSTTWTTGTRTISVSSEAQAISEIDHYQYYISSSSTGQTDGEWKDLENGITSIIISTQGIKYIYFRAISNSGVTGRISNYQITKIDSSTPSAPTVAGGSTELAGSRNFTLTAPSSESGIVEYEYYISSSQNKPATDVTVTGNTTQTNITINKTGTYIFFRAVNSIGTKGEWTTAKNLYVDTSLLSALSVNNYSITPTFSSTTTSYTVNVPYSVTSLTVNKTTANSNATVEVSGNSGFVVGTNTISVKVTGPDATTKTYTITVTRQKDTDNTLKSLSLTNCTLNPTFGSGATEYTCTVENNVTSTTVSAEATSSEATVSVIREPELQVGENIININVTSQSGSIKIYKVIVNRKASSDATLKNLTVSNGTLSPAFASGTTSYTVTVPYSVLSIDIGATVNNSEATLTGTGTKSLSVGDNTFEIKVTAGDRSTKTYTIKVTRQKDTTATLSALSLTNCTLSPAFSSETTEYSCTVENSVASTNVSASATSSVATISGTGSKSLNVGNNTINVVVTAQDGTTSKTYKVVVNRKPNSDATLMALGVTNQTISPTFNKDTLEYTLSVPYSVDNITITGTATQSVSNVEGLGSKTLIVGENTFEVKVIAEDKTTTRIYTLKVTRRPDTDTSLKSISVEGYSIVKVDNNHYTLTIPNNVTSVRVNAEATSSVAIVTGTGIKNDLKVGPNTVQVQVTSQSGAVSVYEIVITRQASSDATLKALSVSGYTISPAFASGTTSYTLTVPYSVSSVTVNATVNNSEASLTGTGSKSLSVGDNTASVKVTAGDGTTKTYTITITRQQDTDNTLKSLSLTNCTLSPTFASGTTSYSCTVANSVSSTTVSATATSSVAKVTGTGAKTLSVGDNTVSVEVTAQNGSKKTYTVTVHRKSNDANLSALSVTGYTISPTFASGTTAYTLTVPNATSSITVNATKNHSAASLTGTGSKSLSVGNNTVTVKVTAEDGNSKEYVITVKRMGADKVTLAAVNTTYTGSAIAANTASATSKSTITYTYYNGTTCNGTVLSGAPTNVGNYSVKAASAGNSDYEPGSTCVTHTITKGTPIISLTAKTAEANGSAIAANTATATNPNKTTIELTYKYTYYNGTTCSGTALSSVPSAYGNYSVIATSEETTNLVSANSACTAHTITKNTNANLKSLTVTGYTISPPFSADIQTYTVKTEASSVNISAIAETHLSSVSGNIGTIDLIWGENIAEIIVTPQSGDLKTYKIIIDNQRPVAPTLQKTPNSDATTSDITISLKSVGSALSGVDYYEYYTGLVSVSDSTTPKGTVTNNLVLTAPDGGTNYGYVWYRTVSKNGYRSEWSSSLVYTIDKATPQISKVTGASTTWTTSKTLTVTAGALSGIKEYCYYVTNSTTLTSDAVFTCGNSNSFEITESGKYIFIKVISGSGMSNANPYDLYVDSEKPEVTASVNGKDVTFTIKDNMGATGYGVNQSTSSTPSYTPITSTTSTTINYTASVAGTLVVWVKDVAGNTATASFDIDQNALCSYEPGHTWTFDYTGDIQDFIVPCDGTYKLETWGAQGGNTQVNSGGLGGYAYGNKVLTKDSQLYIVVGGQGGNGVPNEKRNSTPGYNGGGTGTSNNITGGTNGYGGGGGGATHIGTFNSILADHGSEAGLYIVGAGGGGAAAEYGWPAPDYNFRHVGNNGGAGGGLKGVDGSGNEQHGLGGTQYEGGLNNAVGVDEIRSGSFGLGGTFTAGGGGGYYGGGSGYWQSSAGGGSSYIDGVMNGVTESGVREGNGYARITYISTDMETDIIGTKWKFNYTGSPALFIVPYSGTYTIEALGPQGGKGLYTDGTGAHASNLGLESNFGGYVKADFTLTENTPLYIVVGGNGEVGSTIASSALVSAYNGAGGYNGGTLGTRGGGGSGAVHVASKTGLTADLSTSDIYISAKGGDGQRVLDYIHQELSGGIGAGNNYVSPDSTNSSIVINKESSAGHVVITLKELSE